MCFWFVEGELCMCVIVYSRGSVFVCLCLWPLPPTGDCLFHVLKNWKYKDYVYVQLTLNSQHLSKGLEWLLKHNFYWRMKRSLHTKSSGKEHRLRPPGFKSFLHSLLWGLRCFRKIPWLSWPLFPHCCCSVTKWCLTVCNPTDYSAPGFLSFTISLSL